MKHLGHHLEQLALHAIPQDVFTSDSENESAATGQSGRSSESSVVKGELDVEPTSNIEDSEGETSTRPEDTDRGIIRDPPKLKFKDALDRRFAFPWDKCKTWTGMEGLINEAFEHVEDLRELVHQGRYDLAGPNGEIILPRVWEDTLIQPGWEITMHMWPRRSYQTCIPCRRNKVRCDLGSVDDPDDSPCARCRQESEECFFADTENEDLGLNTDSSTPPVPSFSQEPNPYDGYGWGEDYGEYDGEDYGDPAPKVIERERKPYYPKGGAGKQYEDTPPICIERERKPYTLKEGGGYQSEDSRPISRTPPGVPAQAMYPSSSGPSDSANIPSWPPHKYSDVKSRDARFLYEDYSGTPYERPKDILDSVASASDRRTPVYPKIHRDYVEEATLEYYDIPYQVDENDGNFLILLLEMNKYETDVLFEHTRRLRAGKILDESTNARASIPAKAASDQKAQRSKRDRVPCNLCQEDFAREADLQRHKMDAHGMAIAVYVCTQCDFSVERKDKIMEHCRMKHGESPPRSYYLRNIEEPGVK